MGRAVVLGIVLGVVGGLLLVRLFTPWVARRIMRRRVLPSGTRPQVHMLIDGVTYDLTETLMRVPDDANGAAVWAVLGPQHVRMLADSPGVLAVASPVPRNTHIRLMVTGPPDAVRFYTEQEIREELGSYSPQA